VFSSMNSLFPAHDPRLLAWAAVVCLVAAYGSTNLLRKSQRHTGVAQAIWISVASVLMGLGIWATHFIGALAWNPGFAISFTPGAIDLSLLVAVLISGAGVALATRGDGIGIRFMGGAVVGLAMASIQIFGRAGTVIGGTIGWNLPLLTMVVIAGMALAGLAFVVAMRRHITAGALLLGVATYGMNFGAMAAADFSNSSALPAIGKITSEMMSVGVTVISLIALTITFASMVLEEADRRRAETERQRQLADAEQITEVTTLFELATTHMAQGLCLFGRDGHLEFHNNRISNLFGDRIGDHDLIGMHFRDLAMALQGTSQPVTDAPREEAEHRIDGIISKIISGETCDYMRTMNDGRIIRFLHSPIVDGGWVTTIDDVTSEQRSQAQVAHLAYHDPLTSLLNRAAFNERVDAAVSIASETDVNFAVVAIDLDRFKEINDSYGHLVGDQVLKALGTRLSTGLKEGETIARLGGDEFAALKMFNSIESLREFLDRIESALFARIVTDQVTVSTAGSIGVAVFPDDGGDRSRLLNNADLAMYRAKAEFDRRLCYYEHDMDEYARERRAMSKDLWLAVENNGFHLAYQVQKSVESDEITGYEVLLRWNRPGHGLVPPMDFIPIAEESGAITAIGAWVLRTACYAAAAWPEKYKIAVNISAVQLGQMELVTTVRDVLLQTGLAASRLELEVTETSIIADKQRALHILRQIKAMGVSVAIDDFGTGYSSLDTLRSFPFDKIKIDRSFMADVDNNDQSKAIVRAILALGKSLSVPVLAEGVETSSQLDVLRAEGCNEAQGYFLGRPGEIQWASRVTPLLRKVRL